MRKKIKYLTFLNLQTNDFSLQRQIIIFSGFLQWTLYERIQRKRTGYASGSVCPNVQNKGFSHPTKKDKLSLSQVRRSWHDHTIGIHGLQKISCNEKKLKAETFETIVMNVDSSFFNFFPCVIFSEKYYFLAKNDRFLGYITKYT